MAAIAAIGTKTQRRKVLNVGLKPILLMVGEIIFLATLVLAVKRGQPRRPTHELFKRRRQSSEYPS
ncbi:hypothetical protein [Paraburkholderia hospita]|uniref:hypothetical protein n=1 Tax=Paraburkholderia hospita TaxID=169430 RepID=UPI000B84EA72|nr:hypothetical protein [Paraburkholderia hospita]